jgi:hypothetical protein
MLGQGNALVTPTLGSAFTVSVPPQVLTNVSNTLNLSNGGGSIVVPSLTLTNGSGITINGSWPTQTISASGTTNTPWVKSGNIVTLSAFSDDVGLGMALPTSKLDVAGNATTTTSILKVTNSNTSNSSAAIIVSSNGGAAINATENSAAGANAGEFTSINGGAIYGLTFEETKSAILGANSSTTSNSLAHGIYGKTSNPDPNAAGIFGENLSNGHGIKGVTSGPFSAIRGINQHTATAALTDGVYGSTNNSSSGAAGVYGVKTGGGPDGTGAGGPTATISNPTQADAYVNAAFRSELGRDATAVELTKYRKILNDAEKKNPSKTVKGITTGGINRDQFLKTEIAKLPEFTTKKTDKTKITSQSVLGTAKANGVTLSQSQID